MCNYVLYVTQCRQCGSTISQSQSDYVYCPSYKNGISCMIIERDRRTTLVCCSSCQRSYSLDSSADLCGADECYSIKCYSIEYLEDRLRSED
ncbi:hypothetical protein CKAH01_14505 [Colletotrichum kahawae]|uniref:Uncharacterized protein n=1 Tax=Colletotrichum kahawae TaxID=34407 RepID=A0AAD9YMW2_COLKA|nr:hypothetical protein CKAH01_14505 [Colletotrichum kahawae]